MSRQDWFAAFMIVALILIVGYFAFISMQTQANLLLGVIVLWTILPPVLSNLPYSFKYLLVLFALMSGSWYLLLLAFLQFGLLPTHSIILAPILSAIVVGTFHFLTRGRVVFWKFSLASLSRGGIAALSIMFIPIAVMILNPDALRLDVSTKIVYFTIIYVMYVYTSLLFVNSSYRYYALSNRLKTHSLEKYLENLWEKVRVKFPEEKGDLELLQYYCTQSVTAFLEGDYEKSLMWGYKVIHEPTIVDPTTYVDDKRINKPSFSEIRNTLEHSRRKGHTDAKTVRETLKELPDACLDLVEREIVLLQKIERGELRQPS